jgi:hypothetical protein
VDDREQEQERAEGAVRALLDRLRQGGLAALEPVVGEEDGAALLRLARALADQPGNADGAAEELDYRLMPGGARLGDGADRRRVTATLRRCSGSGDLTFRIDEEGRVLFSPRARKEPLLAGKALELRGLPAALGGLEAALADADRLRKVRLAEASGEELREYSGLTRNVERVEKVVVERLSLDTERRQGVFRLVALEKEVEAEFLLSERLDTVVAIVRLGGKPPREFFQDRIASHLTPQP